MDEWVGDRGSAEKQGGERGSKRGSAEGELRTSGGGEAGMQEREGRCYGTRCNTTPNECAFDLT